MVAETRASRRQRRRAKRRALWGAIVTVLVIVSVPVLLSLDRGTSRRVDGPVTNDDALASVRAAIGKTVASGSYETDNENSSTSPGTASPAPCPPGASCAIGSRPSMFGASSHAIVNLDPFITRIDSDDSYGAHTLYVTPTTVWLLTRGASGPGGPGIPLSQFANSVEGALGPSAGAMAMIGLASPGGSLNLEEEAIADATPAGTGSVNGTDVTYYDVTIDMTKLADTPDLSAMQRQTIEAALPLLGQGGYSGTTERIGVDDAGYVREVTATNKFTDGSTSTRHTVLSNFGCAPKLTAPEGGIATVTPAEPCPAPEPVTTTSSAPSTSTTTTSAPTPTSTTTAPVNVPDTDAIRAVFLAWINAQPKDALGASVEDFAAIADALRQGMAQHSPEDLAKYSGRVDSIQVLSATRAAVVYSVLYNGSPQYAEQPGEAVKIGGVWKVTRNTVCALLAHGGITCPPRTTTASGG